MNVRHILGIPGGKDSAAEYAEQSAKCECIYILDTSPVFILTIYSG